ncbi:MAG TPA: R3H domain-containing nucleic acid-binding protein [Candidatus Saccharimonadales bacterium]|nr:R3H domain-containing nucleic acid-binding protein [Candidatus Saccharimonadales bacterium]
MSESRTDGGEDRWAHLESGSLEEIQYYVEDLVDLAALELDVELHRERDALIVDLVGPDSDLLLDYAGETLEAFQVLLGKILPRKFGTTLRVLVDTKNYRLSREHELIEIAHRSAEKVRASGRAVELSPMNSMERRIVHLALGDEDGIETSSTGEGEDRRVCILPAGAEKVQG